MRRCVLCAIAVLLLVPAVASAATTSAVTSVTLNGQSRFIVNISSPPTVHVAGTSDAANVDIYCVSSQAGGGFNKIPLATSVPVTAGSFTADVTWSTQGACEVFAIQAGSPVNSNTDLNGQSGEKVYAAYTDASTTGGKTYDYFVAAEGSGAEDGFDSFGDCTMDYAQLVQMHEYDGQPFDCNGYVESMDQAAGGSTPSIVVDGHPAYPPYYIGSQGLGALPGWSGLTWAVSDEGGAWHVVSHEGLYRCSNSDTFPPTSCTGFASTGLRLDVDEQLSADARTVVQKLRFVSEDQQPHQMSVVLNQTSPAARQWFFPGTADFLDYGLGAAPSVIAPAVATIRNRISGSVDPDITKGFGAITYAGAPASEPFWGAGRFFVQRYPSLVIPAGRAARVEFIYNMAPGTSALNGQVATAEASIGAAPAISVTSPASAGAAGYNLTGTVNAPEVLNAFTVNDQPVTVGADGSFSMPTTLAEGANAFTLRATDELSRTTTTTFNATLTTAPAPVPIGNSTTGVASVRFGRSGKLSLKGRSLTTGSTATCPSPGPKCTVTASATAAASKSAKVLVLSKLSMPVKSGATVKIKLKLSKAAAKLLARTHKLKVKLVLTGSRAGAKRATATRTLMLSRSR